MVYPPESILSSRADRSVFLLRYFYSRVSFSLYSGTTHADADECYENPKICLNGKCRNTPGSYLCECQPGYTVSPDGTFCTDVNECEKKPGLCRNGKCANTDGSFKCLCDSGYRLSADRQNCIGIFRLVARPTFVIDNIGEGGFLFFFVLPRH